MEKILVSACLLGKNCRYDGKNCFSQKIKELEQEYELIAVCPEELGGLPAPRIPCEIIEGRVFNKEGKDCTEEFMKGAEETLRIAKEEKIKKAVFKSLSPSCGKGTVYDGSFTGKKKAGDGITTALLRNNGIKVYSEIEMDGEKLMTIKEAEAFYKEYGGHLFHMAREDGYRYQLYERLHIPKETEEKWREEIRNERTQS